MNGFNAVLIIGLVFFCAATITTTNADNDHNHLGNYPKDSAVYKRWHAMYGKLSDKCKVIADGFEHSQTGKQKEDCKGISSETAKKTATIGGCTEKEYNMMKEAVCSGVTVWISWSLMIVCLLVQALKH